MPVFDPNTIVFKPLLSKNSKPTKGESFCSEAKNVITLKVYRYDPSIDDLPKINEYQLNADETGPMVLDALIKIKDDIDETLSFRKSCREGSCGSCAVNINGINSLSCTKKISEIKEKEIHVFPLMHMSVVKDLVCDLTKFFEQYKSIKPWLQTEKVKNPEKEFIQTPEERKQIDGLYDCVMCACCSSGCPSYWWNEDKFLGPAALLQLQRWIKDSRDTNSKERLKNLSIDKSLDSCHTIFNCTISCPKSLNPAKEILKLRKEIIKS